MRVKLLAKFGSKARGEIVDLNKKDLEQLGKNNYEEVGEEVEVSKDNTSDCSALQAELEEKQETIESLVAQNKALQEKLVNAKEEFGLLFDFNELMQELKDAKKIADYEAIQAKYTQDGTDG